MATLFKFNEVLNDLMDYFILGDPDYLLDYKIEKGLPDDLLTEFTTKETGDEVVQHGVTIPMIGIENYPYTIYFNLSADTPELMKPENKLQHQRDGYCLRVENSRIYLYTMPYLKDFTAAKIEALKKYKPASIAMENGWYAVTILGGLTRQMTEIKTADGHMEQIETMEPTFEFILQSTEEKPDFTADFFYPFKIELD